MNSIFINKKQIEFEKLFDTVDKILAEILPENINSKINNGEIVYQIRNSLNKNILNAFCVVGNLNDRQINLLDAQVPIVKFSIDTLIKNKVNHPELAFDDYKKIGQIIAKPDEIRLSKNKRNSILLLKKDGKTYQIVIKTTLNKMENFLTSFRFAEH